MSGVFGVVDPRGHGAAERAARMAGRISHMSWHVTRSAAMDEGRVALGHLGIGVFNTEPQPVWNADRSAALVMAGEFYDRPGSVEGTAADAPDSAVALALYQRYGDSFARHVHGVFVIAIWDARRRQVLLVNDRFGLQPIYYASAGGRLLFAPEVKAVLSDPGVDRALRDDAVAEFVRVQRLLGTKTFFAGVHLLRGASVLTCDADTGAVRASSYWSYGELETPPQDIPYEAAVAQAGRLYRRAVDKMMCGSAPKCALLSGGLDSRAVVGFAAEQRASPGIVTYTFGQANSPDVRFGRRLAAAAGVPNCYVPYENGGWVREFAGLHLTLVEGFQSWVHMHSINLLAEMRQRAQVNLSGLGDTLWIELPYTPRALFEAPDIDAFATLLFDLYNQCYTWPGITEGEEAYVFHPRYLPRVSGLAREGFRCEAGRLADIPRHKAVAAFNTHNEFARALLYHAVYGRSHLEFRFPYADLDLYTFAVGLPFDVALNRRVLKGLIAAELPEMARVPYASDGLPLSYGARARALAQASRKLKSALNRLVRPMFDLSAAPYADYERWLRTDLRAWVEGVLLDPRSLDRGVFRPEALRALLQRSASGQEAFMVGKIAHLMTFEMMLRHTEDGA